MPLPQAVARLNKRYTNRLIEPLVARLPGFIAVVHHGRRSGATYRTPLLAFAGADGLLVALTYGPRADWVQNVLAGGGVIERDGATQRIVSSDILARQHAWPHLPFVVRAVLWVLRVSDFMELGVSTSPASDNTG